MAVERIAGQMGRQVLRLLLPLFLVVAGLAPQSLPLHPDLGFLARFAPAPEPANPLRFDRPSDSALFLRPGSATLKTTDSDRRQDGRADTGDADVAATPRLYFPARRASNRGPASLPVRLSAPRFFLSRAPPFLAAA